MRNETRPLPPPLHYTLINDAIQGVITTAADTVIPVNNPPYPGLYPGPYPVNISGIYNHVSMFNGTPVQKWALLLKLFSYVGDGMKARGGDLIHDIGGVPMTTPLHDTGVSMFDFILSQSTSLDTIGPALARYVASIPSIMADFRQFRLSQFAHRPYMLNDVSLRGLTTYLTDRNVNTISLDSQFGNIFRSGFGTNKTLLMSNVCEIDGASKLSQRTAVRCNLNYAVDNTPFTLPYLYGDVKHTITHTQIGGNYVNISYPTIAPPGIASISVSCTSGISVKAVCDNVGLEIRRGGDAATNPITISDISPNATYLQNHIVMIKTMTDWAQLAYVKLLTLLGIQTVFITNDQYCLALAAAMGLPYVIRTPAPNSEYIEFYEFDPISTALTPAEQDQIRNNMRLTAPICTQISEIMANFNLTFQNVYACMIGGIVPIVPITVRDYLIQKLNSIINDLNTGILADCQTITNTGAGPDVNNYRQLIYIGLIDYINDFIRTRLTNICTSFINFGVQMQSMNNEIEKDVVDEDAALNIFKKYILLILEFCTNDDGITDTAGAIQIINSINGNDTITGFLKSALGQPVATKWSPLYTRAAILAIQRHNISLLNTPEILGAINITGGWLDQGLKMKRALYHILRNYNINITRLPAAPPCYIAPGTPPLPVPLQLVCVPAPPPVAMPEPEMVGMEGGRITDIKYQNMTNQEFVGRMNSTKNHSNSINDNKSKVFETYIYYTTGDDNYHYKPSCSKEVGNLINHLNKLDISDKFQLANHIIKILSSMSIDAYESHMGEYYNIKLFDINEMLDEVKNKEVSFTDFAFYILDCIFNNNVMMFITEVLSPIELRTFLQYINELGQVFNNQLDSSVIQTTSNILDPVYSSSSTPLTGMSSNERATVLNPYGYRPNIYNPNAVGVYGGRSRKKRAHKNTKTRTALKKYTSKSGRAARRNKTRKVA